ncbi:MAG: hypothetical protein ACI9G6_003271, partial [Limisphaerales bacterium]
GYSCIEVCVTTCIKGQDTIKEPLLLGGSKTLSPAPLQRRGKT